MSLLYLVDGYNALIGSGLFEIKDINNARLSFLNYLGINRPHGSIRNKLIVVFDGSCENYSRTSDYSLEVIFSGRQSADDKIKSIVESYEKPKNIVVVTDDRDIILYTRKCGAVVISVSDFLIKNSESRQEKRYRRPGNDTEPASGLNIVEREAITEELKKIWLRKKS